VNSHARHEPDTHQHAGHDHRGFRRAFWLSLISSVPVVLTSPMVMDWFGYSLDFPGRHWIGPILGSVIFCYGGWPFLAGAATELRHRAPGMMLLISMAITVAYLASLATSLGWFDLEFWWELATLVTIMLLGHWQQMKAIGQAQGALAALAALLPDEAERVTTDGGIQRVALSQLRPGDIVLVRPGSRVPADGEVVTGAADLDESMITGESQPVPRGVGDRVVAGTVAIDAALRVRVTAVGDDTALAGIQRLVAQAQQSRGRAQVLADRFAALLFYAAAGTGVLTFLIWWLLGDAGQAVTHTVTVLVISCPHALGLAIPLVISLSTALAARSGILIKDRLALRVAAAVEADSEHPLARALVTAAARTRLAEGRAGTVTATGLPQATDFQVVPGRGVQATVDGRRYAVGGPGLLRDLDLPLPEVLDIQRAQWSQRGAAVLYLIEFDAPPAETPGPASARVLAAFALADTVRPQAREAITALRRQGVGTIAMLTGDAWPVAEAVAADLGVDEVYAEVLPADKDRAVAALQARGLTVAMVGDGVNDAPALARADVGIAIGAGTDVALESAGVVLASSDPRGVDAVLRLSRASYRKMVQNLAWAAGYNAAAIPLAAGVLAWAGITLGPAVGAVLMSASTIVVAFNAQLLRRVRLTPAPSARGECHNR